MYGDFSRLIAKLKLKFSALYMQQGRVQLDSDWNMQAETQRHNQQTYLRDIIGSSGVPHHNAGFGIQNEANELTISAGNFYINGELCENPESTVLTKQPYSRTNTSYSAGFYLAYLSTWQQTVTWIDEPALQEVALNIDSCVAARTAWQVNLLKLSTHKQLEERIHINTHDLAVEYLPFGGIEKIQEKELDVEVIEHISVNFNRWQRLLHEKSGQIKLNIAEEGAIFNNHLYRIEIHGTGGAYGEKNHKHTPQYVIKPTANNNVFKFNENTHLHVWRIGQIVEVFPEQAIGNLATVTAINSADHTITLEFHDQSPNTHAHHKKLHIRAIATYKWSRNNAASITEVTNIAGDTLTIKTTANTDTCLLPGAWIELSDNTLQPGMLLQIKQVDENQIRIVNDLALQSVSLTSPITLRVWDSNQRVVRHDEDLLLENGISACFISHHYETSHYWCCHTRTFRQHDWPMENNQAIPQASLKQHQFIKLALVAFDGDTWITSPHWDFRQPFLPLNQMQQSTGNQSSKTHLSPKEENTVIVNNELPKDGVIMFETKQAPKHYTTTGASLVATCWDNLTDLPIPCRDAAISVIGNDIYVIGGIDADENYLATTYRFNTQNKQWQRKENMPTARANLGVATIDNKLYAIGGQTFDEQGIPTVINYVEVYDPQTDTWEKKKPMPFGSHSFGIAVLNHTIYILGGGAESKKGSIFHQIHRLFDQGLHHGHYNQQYNVKKDSWHIRTSIPTPRFGLTACVLNNRIHTFGGTNGKEALRTHEIYDPEMDMWSEGYALSTPRFSATAVNMNNKIMLLGGYDGRQFLTAVEQYDTQYELWNEIEQLPIGRIGSAITAIDQQVYSFGGELDDLGVLAETLRLTLNKRFYLHRYNGVKTEL